VRRWEAFRCEWRDGRCTIIYHDFAFVPDLRFTKQKSYKQIIWGDIWWVDNVRRRRRLFIVDANPDWVGL